MLSVVIASRNDDHGGNMIARTNTFIRALAAQARKHELPVELILVEWNPPEGVPSLRNCLAWPCEDPYFCSRVIVVPPEIHNLMENSDKLAFYQMIAKNVGIRRARYPWVLATNPDLLFPDKIFNVLKGELDPACFYRAARADVGLRILDDSLSVLEQLALCRQNVVRVHGTKKAKLHTGACGDFTLMAKAAWMTLRGYTEFDLWSIHIDTVFLYWADRHGYKEHMIPGGQCFHLEHYGAWVTNPEYGEGKPKMSSAQAARHQKRMHEGKFAHNRANWGMAGVPLSDYAVSGEDSIMEYADLTLFTVPKAFAGTADQIQRNAIESWQQLRPLPHIVLIGDAPGVAAYARERRLEHCPVVKTNESGTPTLDGILDIVQSAPTTHVGLVNADIVLLDDFMPAFDVLAQRLETFLMVGKRTNCVGVGQIDFSTATWTQAMRRLAEAEGVLHAAGALDYFVFQPGAYKEVIPFAIGRTAWDNWLVVHADAFGVDVSLACLAIHQDHPGAYGGDAQQTRDWAFNGPEAKANRTMARGHKLGSLNHAQGVLSADLKLAARVGYHLPGSSPSPSTNAIPPNSRERRGYTRPPSPLAPTPTGGIISSPNVEIPTRRGYSRPEPEPKEEPPPRVRAPRPMLPTTYVRSRDRKKRRRGG